MRQTELVSASRVAILEQLSASIGEINQPISALVLNAEAALQLLRAQPTNTGAVRRLLACIVKDGLRTGDIVRRTRALIEKAPPVSETQCPVNVDSGRSVSKIFYAETFATTRRAIFWIKPTDAIRPNDKIRRVENVTLDEIQHHAIDLRSLRLH